MCVSFCMTLYPSARNVLLSYVYMSAKLASIPLVSLLHRRLHVYIRVHCLSVYICNLVFAGEQGNGECQESQESQWRPPVQMQRWYTYVRTINCSTVACIFTCMYSIHLDASFVHVHASCILWVINSHKATFWKPLHTCTHLCRRERQRGEGAAFLMICNVVSP